MAESARSNPSGEPAALMRGELSAIRLEGARSTLEVTPHGAHVVAWQPAGARPVLFTSAQSEWRPGRPIRGGVPLVFPWFGPKAGDSAAPAHGFARIREWSVLSATRDAGGACTVELRLNDDAATRAQWPHAFEARLLVRADDRLSLRVEVRNTGTLPFTFECALHTYFAVGDVRRARVHGLEGVEFLDKVDGMKRKRQPHEPIGFTGETDRVYLDTTSTCTIEDPVWQRRIVIEKSGSRTTVVWNPWIAKAKAMADFGDDEWPDMLCVETANANANAMTLAPGSTHALEAVISVAAS
jgi:D-hexose-6-phosphate mutarotase